MTASRLFDVVRDPGGDEAMEVHLTGIALLRLVLVNKGTAFSYEERRDLDLDGLLPPQVNTLEQQLDRAYRGFLAEPTPLARYQFLRALQERQEILFHALLARHLDEMLPIVYTPTVGDAVQRFSAMYQNPRGLSLSPLNIDRARELVDAYPLDDVRMIVATDSSAILGIGDQGYGGLAIPIGKLALYTAAGGVSPFHTMPVSLDVGTDRQDLLDDPFYLGVRMRRLRGDAYLAFVDRFVEAVRARWPGAVIQWEDLAKDSAFTVLDRHRGGPSFNDDIQGTGAIALAGLVRACALRGERLRDQTVVVHGAGAGGIGVAAAIRRGLIEDGLTDEAAAARVLVLDSRGLLVDDRALDDYKRPFAQPRARIEGWGTGGVPDLLAVVERSRATALLGLSGQPRAFGEPVVRALAANTARPVVFPLSNPTASCEAEPADVLAWTGGRALVATGSPFAPVRSPAGGPGGEIRVGQGNNAFVFPGLGHGAILAGATRVTDGMVAAAALAVARYTAEHHPDALFPPVADLPAVSRAVTVAVIERACAEGVATAPSPIDAAALAARSWWQPRYLPVRRARALSAAARRAD
jgi:malate dehydrogenase (oxaloacetate-decarboxylating)